MDSFNGIVLRTRTSACEATAAIPSRLLGFLAICTVLMSVQVLSNEVMELAVFVKREFIPESDLCI